MSNCIEFVNNATVKFTAEQFDIDLLLKDYEEHKEHGHGDDFFDWFLRDNFWIEDGELYIQFGAGNSSHTQRDFRGLCELLVKYTVGRKIKRHRFSISDEGDGYETYCDEVLEWPFDIKAKRKAEDERFQEYLKAHPLPDMKNVKVTEILTQDDWDKSGMSISLAKPDKLKR